MNHYLNGIVAVCDHKCPNLVENALLTPSQFMDILCCIVVLKICENKELKSEVKGKPMLVEPCVEKTPTLQISFAVIYSLNNINLIS